jgi:hypothetical protein
MEGFVGYLEELCSVEAQKKKSWQLLLHRFPTRDNLAKRDFINVVSEADCIWFKFEEGQIIEYHLW